ncbi:hypothetical protein GW17_00027812 [Ensete ventricosum]|nr:hypothetical protein GW17_00027812 [Ensete ventricosum]RZR89222.1 hypothetical protein BHM03_00016919 [Ensete ventricosum]
MVLVWDEILALYTVQTQYTVNSKVFSFELYRLVRALRTNPTGPRYADRPLPCGTVEIEVSPCRNEALPLLLAQE